MASNTQQPVVFVLFGAAGDLSRRKVLPAWISMHQRGLLPERWRLIGSGMNERSNEEYRGIVEESLTEHGDGLPLDWDDVVERIEFVGGGFTEDNPGGLVDAVARAKEDLGDEAVLVHYLAIPPEAFDNVTRALAANDLTEGTRVVFEKPYGTSLDSFEELDALVKTAFSEEQVFRIDHFLGKEAVQNLYVMRFANELFGGVWHRDHVAQVQIDVPEELDVAQRAEFYDATGAALDMLVTHLFQVAAQVAMEPPEDLRDPESVIAAREEALSHFRALDPAEVVLGQYDGYRDIDGVAPDSDQDTFVAARLWVDTDRWRDVPFLLRTGKRMAASAQQVTLVLRSPRGPLMREVDRPNSLSFSLKGSGELTIHTTVKTPGPEMSLTPAQTELELGEVGDGGWLAPYASLLHDVLTGDRTLFTSAAGLRHAFTAFAPLQSNARPTPQPYEPGSWGPAEAASLAEAGDRGRRWFLGQ
ncbi:glucose-6-phosphate dehydrogenase [Georgenia sp. 10Sc9-8]|uniref:Glucose-6-phosphate 1-dehydrogenase n=1 Tax=Georgenia halotolerans TaxID=3028317 RepID=A0ABT5TYE8_9MICO|nr:glucose-6-phosphate dehydrogenase [Georgenia halotolerans]